MFPNFKAMGQFIQRFHFHFNSQLKMTLSLQDRVNDLISLKTISTYALPLDGCVHHVCSILWFPPFSLFYSLCEYFTFGFKLFQGYLWGLYFCCTGVPTPLSVAVFRLCGLVLRINKDIVLHAKKVN